MTKRRFWPLCLAAALLLSGCEDTASNGSAANQDSTQGSRARFALVGDYLYTISGSALQLFDISTPQSPNPWARVELAWDIETLFPYEQYLLVGSETGMHVLENSDPASPQHLYEFAHARSCEPVVAENGTAYITLRADDTCVAEDANANKLEIVDISNIAEPALIRSYAMQAPSGLAIDNATLFVCDSIAGLKVFDVTDPAAIEVLDVHVDVDCFDVITRDGRLFVSVENQLLQYDYSSFPMTQLSALSYGE